MVSKLRRKQQGVATLTDIGNVVVGSTSFTLGGVFTIINDSTIVFFGVPLTVISMAAGGSLVSFAYGDKVPRKRLYWLALANTFLATICVAVIPAWFGWDWASSKIQPALAALFAVSARWIVPQVIALVPEILRKIFRLPPKENINESK